MAQAGITAIGKYEIIELIGEGAMGVVYKARDSVLERIVAIKVMNESIVGQEGLRERFLREARAAGSLQHPNVVTIHDLGEMDQHLFIAMEFIEGVDLEHLVQLSEPLSVQARLDIIIDVLHGLAYAHKRGIVHRDIKPANIRVAEDGRAKIMDFGVAHLVSSTMTSSGVILGTPTYMAPEQIAEGKTSAATDVFSVGAVLYQILTMVKPFDAPTLPNLLFKIVTENPRPVSELVKGIPPALDRVVAKAMAKDPAARYSSASVMANDLSSVRSTLSGPAIPLSQSVQSVIEQSRQKSRAGLKKFAYLTGSVLVALALLAFIATQVARYRSAKSGTIESRAPIETSLSQDLARASSLVVPSRKTGGSTKTASAPPTNTKLGTHASPVLPQSSTLDLSAADKTEQRVIAVPTASVCNGDPHCAEVSTFVAIVTDLRQSLMDGGVTRVVSVSVRFRNSTGRPLILGYVSGSGVVTDDRGNRYTIGQNGVHGLGVIGGGPIDDKFTLRPGESGDARFEFMWAPRGALFGTRFVVELAVREIESISGNQFRLGPEHELRFREFGGSGVASTQQ